MSSAWIPLLIVILAFGSIGFFKGDGGAVDDPHYRGLYSEKRLSFCSYSLVYRDEKILRSSTVVVHSIVSFISRSGDWMQRGLNYRLTRQFDDLLHSILQEKH